MSVFDLFGLEGTFVTEVRDDPEGFRVVELQLESDEVPVCGCDAPLVAKHGRRKVMFRDLPLHRQQTKICLDRQRFRCQSCGSILLQAVPWLDADRKMTVRLRQQIEEDGIKRTFTDAAALNGVDETLVRRIFKQFADRELRGYEVALPRVLGMDEKVLQGQARFVIGDVETRRLLDMQPSRKIADLEKYFHDMEFRSRVEVITQDMYWGYKEINERFFRQATVVIDKFHVVRYANLAVEAVRKAVQSKLPDADRVTMKHKNRLLAMRADRLNDNAAWELSRLFKAHPIIEKAFEAKEFFYGIYDCDDRVSAEREFEAWRDLLPKELEGPFKPLLSCFRHARWRKLIFNYFDHPYTNAYTEALNGLIDQINRSGRGYDLSVLRAKALLRYGKFDEPAFNLIGEPPEMWDEILALRIGHGIDLSTFEDGIRREALY